MPFLDRLRIEESDEIGYWRLLEPVSYEGRDDEFIVPAGYETDFASVPRFMQWLIRPYGVYTRAAVVHDYLITEVLPVAGIRSRDVDGLFRRIMREEGVSFARRWVMWAAVRAGAAVNPKRWHGLGLVRDLPRLLAVGVPAVLVVGPAALAVLVTIAVVWPLTWRRPRP